MRDEAGGSLRKTVRWMWLAVLGAAIYAAVVVGMRWQEQRAGERAAEEKAAEANRQIVDKLGGGELKILAFYASPPVIERGTSGLLCYGVASAKTVAIKPDVEPLAPSLSRCVEIKPAANTTYTLTTEDAAGKRLSQAVEVRVR